MESVSSILSKSRKSVLIYGAISENVFVAIWNTNISRIFAPRHKYEISRYFSEIIYSHYLPVEGPFWSKRDVVIPRTIGDRSAPANDGKKQQL
jgi:hypothetical protein